MADASPWIINTSAEKFQEDVIDRSQTAPIVVDFWAPWCGPCRQLTPILEGLAKEFDGKFILVKVNIDEAQPIAAAFGVQSIPFVVALREEQLISQFLGLRSEDEIREWLTAIVPSRAQELIAEGESIEADKPEDAKLKYSEALQLNSEEVKAKIGLARVNLSLGQIEESRSILAELEQRGFLEPEAEKVRAQLDIATAAEDVGDVEDARQAVSANPDDLNLKLKLADALAASRQYEEALEVCLEIIAVDKSGVGAEAKETMVNIFELLGPESELAGNFRRKLATLLY